MQGLFTILLSFWILLGSLMPGNDMEEMAKIPDLIGHYLEHKASAGNDFSFARFITEHYNQKKESDSDQAHKKLPFFEHQCPGLVFVIPQFHFLMVQPLDWIKQAHPVLQVSQCLSPFSEYWQPPKLSGSQQAGTPA